MPWVQIAVGSGGIRDPVCTCLNHLNWYNNLIRKWLTTPLSVFWSQKKSSCVVWLVHGILRVFEPTLKMQAMKTAQNKTNQEFHVVLDQRLPKAEAIESGLKEAVLDQFAKFNPDRFIPYIQMHELEALLFGSVQ